MKLLLDAHVFLWFIAGNEKLSTTARSAIENSNNRCFVSAGTLWEIAIKTGLGRLRISVPFNDLISHQLRLNGFSLLQIHAEHLETLISLPFYHRDPFDRLLIAQAKAETMNIVSSDSALDAYEVKRLW